MTLAGTRPPLISETNLYEPHHKGMNLIESAQQELVMVERTLEEALIDGRSLKEPFPRHKKQKVFRQIYEKKGFIDAIHESVGDEIRECKKANRKMHMKRNIKMLLYKTLGIRIQGGKIYRGN